WWWTRGGSPPPGRDGSCAVPATARRADRARPPAASLRLALPGQAVLRRVVALAVDGGHLRPHRPQVHRELPAMVDAVVHRDLQEAGRGKLEHPAEVQQLGQLIPGRAWTFCSPAAKLSSNHPAMAAGV